MITKEEVRAWLVAHADEGYRAFHGKLLKNDAVRLLGVRVPLLRQYARQLKGEWTCVRTFPNEYYEDLFLKCAIAGLLPYEQYVEAARELVPLLDNWAVCDCFTARCIRSHREEMLPLIMAWLQDGREFVVRYGLVCLLHDYVEREYLPVIFESVAGVSDKDYYVAMGAAWLLSEVLVHFYQDGCAFLRQGRVSSTINNLAIRKARESFRLTPEEKAGLLPLEMS